MLSLTNARRAGSLRSSSPMTNKERLRDLPAVGELVDHLSELPHPVAVAAARAEIASRRDFALLEDAAVPEIETMIASARRRAQSTERPSLQPVINATGTVLHTNLGRAPLAKEAASAAVTVASGYSNLELDLVSGNRNSRQTHLDLACAMTGAEAVMAVNNNAAAVLLALAAIGSGREVIVSRGELVEIGGGFRIHEILRQSGARLVEVGTTNRTRRSDFERAIGPHTAALLRVHQSNFRTVGFVSRVSIGAMVEVAKARGVRVIDDLGSGALKTFEDEPVVSASVAAGTDLVCFSADKLIGGPQAGLIAGSREAVDLCARHPLARALRIDKLQLAALEATLRLHRDGQASSVPAIRMIEATEDELSRRARLISDALGTRASIARSNAVAGGGTLPLTSLGGPVCLVDPSPLGADSLAARLRAARPAVIVRIRDGHVLLDPRTLTDLEAKNAIEAVRRVLR